ncbi:hypothetical protein RFI_08948 [Reticulomyxa filosa]|uniref:Uncharacterized protein n=1 Tax=Reticulomyxa filosa TaxID=46433 RepID=X6NPG9_RETFI|nr:hypothetical protein RFI_08948 [Reticulomyxa filosa]|eukprot:ETO28185.1 hypothetical protein RFI_08948 [Reticulomyxa filosa]
MQPTDNNERGSTDFERFNSLSMEDDQLLDEQNLHMELEMEADALFDEWCENGARSPKDDVENECVPSINVDSTINDRSSQVFGTSFQVRNVGVQPMLIQQPSMYVANPMQMAMTVPMSIPFNYTLAPANQGNFGMVAASANFDEMDYDKIPEYVPNDQTEEINPPVRLSTLF